MNSGLSESGEPTPGENAQNQLKNENPGLYEIYEESIIKTDTSALVEKTNAQIKELTSKFGNKNLRKFRCFVNDLIVIRSDSSGDDIFKAPIHTGIQTGGGTYYIDNMVRAQNYVYASFDKIAHHMTHYNSGKDFSEQNAHCIEEGDFLNNAELVFCDIANVSMAGNYGNGVQRGELETYMLNCFSYAEGKELLALYLSIVFDTPDNISEYFKYNSPQFAQHWHQSYRDTDDEKKIQDKMKEIFLETAILPPVSLEIRIQNEVKKGNIQNIIDSRKTFVNKIMDLLANKR